MNALEGNRLYVIDYNWLEVKEYEIVKETPRRIYYKDVGSCYKGGYYYDKYKWDGPNKNLFADPLKALEVLDGVIAQELGKLTERQRRVEEQRQAILTLRQQQNDVASH